MHINCPAFSLNDFQYTVFFILETVFISLEPITEGTRLLRVLLTEYLRFFFLIKIALTEYRIK